jgi:hypothetical protein
VGDSEDAHLRLRLESIYISAIYKESLGVDLR